MGVLCLQLDVYPLFEGTTRPSLANTHTISNRREGKEKGERSDLGGSELLTR